MQCQHPTGVIVADSVTLLGPDARGAVLVAASHGGAYAAYLASASEVRAVILNDAGVGRDRAGVGALDYGSAMGMAVATVSSMSCRIGDAADMMERGWISHANAAASGCGVTPGMSCREAAGLLTGAPPPGMKGAAMGESRRVLEPASADGRRIVLVDSAALVEPEDSGQVVVTGSHGGLVGGNPAKALRIDAFAAFFNDAGGGCDEAGFGRLPALDRRGIAGVTVSADSARIGEAKSTYRDGTISAVNACASELGAGIGRPAKDFIDALAKLAEK